MLGSSPRAGGAGRRRPIPIDRAKLPPLDYCLTSSGDGDEASPAWHPSYPDFCIPWPPPDLNCQDLPETEFTVKTAEGDPHGFDGDADGLGCDESTPEPVEPPTQVKGPTGVLGTSSVRPVRVGMPSEQVEGLFGPPECKEELHLGGQGPAPQIDWIWDFDNGEFRLALIRDQYGDQLEESMVGEGSYLLSEGEPGSYWPGPHSRVDTLLT